MGGVTKGGQQHFGHLRVHSGRPEGRAQGRAECGLCKAMAERPPCFEARKIAAKFGLAAKLQQAEQIP